jgi:transposase InsO family protein
MKLVGLRNGELPSAWRRDDNGFFSTLRSELGEHFDSNGDAKMVLFDYIEVFYNQKRRHSAAGRMNPAAFERQRSQAA